MMIARHMAMSATVQKCSFSGDRLHLPISFSRSWKFCPASFRRKQLTVRPRPRLRRLQTCCRLYTNPSWGKTATVKTSISRPSRLPFFRAHGVPTWVLECPAMPSTLTHLECSRSACGHTIDYSPARNLCPECGSPLLARYDLDKAKQTLTLDSLRTRPHTMWRYDEVLPDARPVTLGEGGGTSAGKRRSARLAVDEKAGGRERRLRRRRYKAEHGERVRTRGPDRGPRSPWARRTRCPLRRARRSRMR